MRQRGLLPKGLSLDDALRACDDIKLRPLTTEESKELAAPRVRPEKMTDAQLTLAALHEMGEMPDGVTWVLGTATVVVDEGEPEDLALAELCRRMDVLYQGNPTVKVQ